VTPERRLPAGRSAGVSPASPVRRLEAGETAAETAAFQLRINPLTGSARDYDALLTAIGERRFVLIGEASHGTHEFYRERAGITKRLIAEKGFTVWTAATPVAALNAAAKAAAGAAAWRAAACAAAIQTYRNA